MILYFTYESRDTITSFYLFVTVKTIAGLNLGLGDKFKIEILKISHRGSRSSDTPEFGQFTLLFCRGRQRNAPKIITHVHAIVLLIKPFVSRRFRYRRGFLKLPIVIGERQALSVLRQPPNPASQMQLSMPSFSNPCSGVAVTRVSLHYWPVEEITT